MIDIKFRSSLIVLFVFLVAKTVTALYPSDDDEVFNWIEVSGGSMMDLVKIVEDSSGLTAIKFTDNITYFVNCTTYDAAAQTDECIGLTVVNDLMLSTAPDVQVTFEVNYLDDDDGMYGLLIDCQTFYCGIKGDFIVTGILGGNGMIIVNGEMAEMEIEGFNFQNIESSEGPLVTNNNGILTLDSTTFENNRALSILNFGGNMTLNNVIVRNCTLPYEDEAFTPEYTQILNLQNVLPGVISGSVFSFKDKGNKGPIVNCGSTGCSQTSRQNQATIINGTNGGSWETFYQLWEEENYQKIILPGPSFEFTESIEYTITTDEGLVMNGLDLYLYTVSNDITVTINVPCNKAFILQETGYLNIKGNFLIQGDSTCSTQQQAISMIQGTADIEGVTIQNFFNPKATDGDDDGNENYVAAIVNNDATFTITSTTFKNCNGTIASAISNNGGVATLKNVTVENSIVTDPKMGAQIFNGYGSMSGSDLYFKDNLGPNYRCNPDALECSLPPQELPLVIVNSTNAATWEAFYQLWQSNFKFPGASFQFTESITYTVSEALNVFWDRDASTIGSLYLSIASSNISVTINVPNRQTFLRFTATQGTSLNLKGNFIIQGDPACAQTYCEQFALILGCFLPDDDNDDDDDDDDVEVFPVINIEGIIIQDFKNNYNNASAAVSIYEGSQNSVISLASTTFRNCQGPFSSAINNDGANVILNNVMIEDSVIKYPLDGAQIYSDNGLLSGNATFTNNVGQDFLCVNIVCSLSTGVIQTISVNSSNGATWEKFYELWGYNTFPGVIFNFTESVNYTITTNEGLLMNNGELHLYTASSDIKVTITVPNEKVFLVQSGGNLVIDGNFVIQGNSACTSWQSAIQIGQIKGNDLLVHINGITIEDFSNNASQSQYTSNIANAAILISCENLNNEITIASSTFRNCHGSATSAIANYYGNVTFDDVLVENCIVTEIDGGQLGNFGGNMVGNVTFNNNEGLDFIAPTSYFGSGTTDFSMMQYVKIDSSNAPTFKDFSTIYTQTGAGWNIDMSFEFTENLTYFVNAQEDSIIIYLKDIYLSTAPGVSVYFNFECSEDPDSPNNNALIYQGAPEPSNNYLSVIGDFIFQVVGSPCQSTALQTSNAYIEGITIQNFVNNLITNTWGTPPEYFDIYYGVVSIWGFYDPWDMPTTTIINSTFRNIKGSYVSAISIDGSSIGHLENVLIEDCTVVNPNGAQIYLDSDEGSAVTGSVTFMNINGTGTNGGYGSLDVTYVDDDDDNSNDDSNNDKKNDDDATKDDDNNNDKKNDDDGTKDDDNNNDEKNDDDGQSSYSDDDKKSKGNDNGGKIAGIIIAIVIFFCCVGGGLLFWVEQNKRKNKLKTALLPNVVEDAGREGSVQVQYQQF